MATEFEEGFESYHGCMPPPETILPESEWPNITIRGYLYNDTYQKHMWSMDMVRMRGRFRTMRDDERTFFMEEYGKERAVRVPPGHYWENGVVKPKASKKRNQH